MTPNHLAILALDIAHERVAEAEQARLARSASRAGPSPLRRSLARFAGAISQWTAALAYRLDDGTVDGDRRRGSVAA